MAITITPAPPEPAYDEAVDISYDEQPQADVDEAAQPDADAGTDPDYGDDFRDPDAEEGSQEWRFRPQK